MPPNSKVGNKTYEVRSPPLLRCTVAVYLVDFDATVPRPAKLLCSVLLSLVSNCYVVSGVSKAAEKPNQQVNVNLQSWIKSVETTSNKWIHLFALCEKNRVNNPCWNLNVRCPQRSTRRYLQQGEKGKGPEAREVSQHFVQDCSQTVSSPGTIRTFCSRQVEKIRA